MINGTKWKTLEETEKTVAEDYIHAIMLCLSRNKRSLDGQGLYK